MKLMFDDAEFDRVVHNSLPDMGEQHLAFVIKENATEAGNPAMCITFVSMTDSGPKRVQCVITVKNFLQAFGGLWGRYEYLTDREWAPKEAVKAMSGHEDGVGWNAVMVEQAYLISCENGAMGLATTEASCRKVAAELCRRGDHE